MRKISFFVSLLLSLFLAGCSPVRINTADDSEPSVSGDGVELQQSELETFTSDNNRLKGYEVIGSIPEKELFIYGKPNKDGGAYDKIAVSLNDRIKFYNWKSIKKEPAIAAQDLTGDGIDEIAIIFSGGYGTGIYNSFLHILDSKSLKEIPVESAGKILESKVRKKLLPDKIVIDTNGKEHNIIVNGNLLKDIYDNLFLGASIFYSLEDGKVKCTSTVQSEPSLSYGSIEIFYSYSNDKFVMNTVNYNPSE